MNRYRLKDIYSLCGLFPNDFKVYKNQSSYGITSLKLNTIIIAFQQVSNKRYEIHAITNCFMFSNSGIAPCDSNRMVPSVFTDYVFKNVPDRLSDYLRYFRDNYQYVEKAYKEFLYARKLNNISEDFK